RRARPRPRGDRRGRRRGGQGRRPGLPGRGPAADVTARIRRVVVVGNGIAGLTAADSLRDAGFDGELTIVGDEPHPAYSRPALSKALLLGGGDLSAHELPPATHGAEELLGVRASGLDVERRLVRLADGTALPYDRRVIATGSRARRLSELPGEFTLRGLDDALALRDRLAGRPDVAVVGGGPLGMEIASACLASGCRVTLVSQGPPLIEHLGPYLSEVFAEAARALRAGRAGRPEAAGVGGGPLGREIASACLASGCRVTLVSQGPPLIEHLGPYLSEVFAEAARERGLTIVETAAARLEPGVRVRLAEGGVVEAGLVVSAVGDVPNTEWLAGSGLTGGGALRVCSRGLVRA